MRLAPSANNLLRIFDAIYDVERPRDRWLSGLLEAASLGFDLGAGVGGLLYDIAGEGQFSLDYLEGLNVPPAWDEVGHMMHGEPRLIPPIVARYRTSLCSTLPDLISDAAPFMNIQDVYARHAIGGQIMINGVDCSGKGCALFLFSRRAFIPTESQRDLFSRMATHLSTAYRLQRRYTDGLRPQSVEAEAVLTPEGRVAHAEANAQTPGARNDLSLAVRRRERGRGATEWHAGRVVKSLSGLISARWTLIDHYESDGKRYVLACENGPNPSGWACLSEREKQVASLAVLGRSNKLIAYELGLAHSTVRVLMARACEKLGASSRDELISQRIAPLTPNT